MQEQERTQFPASSRRSKQTGESMLNRVIVSIIQDCHKHDPQNHFRYPVDKRLAPGYRTRIAQPICLEEMSQRAKRQEYGSIQAFKDDMLLMRNNAEQYNGLHDLLAQTARQLEAVAQDAIVSPEYKDAIEEAMEKINLHQYL
jgi:hypothetical protein